MGIDTHELEHDGDDDDGEGGVGGRGWEKRKKGGVTDDLWGFITNASKRWSVEACVEAPRECMWR